MTADYLKKGHRLRPGGVFSKTSVTIHSTANPNSTAKNERGWLDNPVNTREASWHYCVDDCGVIQAIPEEEEAWHCGKNEGNKRSIGIEICESGDRKKALEEAAKLTAQILLRRGLGIGDIKRHYDWTGKNCPRILMDAMYIKGQMNWAYFLEEVKKQMEPVPQWKKEMISYMLEKGWLNEEHEPTEKVDMATLGAVLKNMKMREK
ncbi:MAG: N-acetylmuramoyl-L-alanine amidase [Clostridiales bacterium]|nr:N-acetylmuramoyl-L-alanine amidase [Clostridiales bacterium]